MTTDRIAPSPRRLGVVSFLNARPLIEGLTARGDIDITFDVPARLPGLLEDRRVEAALVPVIDLVRPHRRWKLISDACIGSDGETFTVRIFSKVPPQDIHRLHVDGDSHTSVALATVIWLEKFGRRLEVIPLSAAANLAECEAILLIGDKVVNHQLVDFDLQTDLGGAWKSLTGLPFVFAAWAAHAEEPDEPLAGLLNAARNRGVANAAAIAENIGPGLGWPVELAKRYLMRRLSFRLTSAHREGLHLFLSKVRAHNLVPGMQEPAFA